MENTNQNMKYQIHRCKYGCGQEGTYKQKDGTYSCSEHWTQCPVGKKRMKIITRKRHPEMRQLEQDLEDGKLKCYICGEVANFLLVGSSHNPCCCDKASKCLGYHRHIGDIQIESYKHRHNHYYGKKRPEHTFCLLRANELGSYGGYCYHHKAISKLLKKENCELCGISNEECIDKYNRSLEMHNIDRDYTNYEEDNWMTLCRGCHMNLHAEERKAA